MSTYIDLLGANNMKRHDHLIIKTKPIIKDDTVIIEFEEDYIISNCLYYKDGLYGVSLVPIKIEKNKVVFVSCEDCELTLEEVKEINEFEIGDKLDFHGILGGYGGGLEYKYVELKDH